MIDTQVPCPFCRESIDGLARECPYCLEHLGGEWSWEELKRRKHQQIETIVKNQHLARKGLSWIWSGVLLLVAGVYLAVNGRTVWLAPSGAVLVIIGFMVWLSSSRALRAVRRPSTQLDRHS